MDLSVQMETHAVSCQVVVMDVVLSQMLFVVQMVFIVVRKATPVHLELARKDLM
jgi:hypothetical protein